MLKTKYILDYVARDILEFWFSEINSKKWWNVDHKFDSEVKDKYELIYQRAKHGAYDHFVDIPEEILALIIIFDQFPRNMFRGTKKAFESDVEALELCKHAINYKMDHKIHNKNFRHFLYMPLMHSENPKDQIISLEKFANISKEAYQAALEHKKIIDTFGRFPYRNSILERKSSEEERKFLASRNILLL